MRFLLSVFLSIITLASFAQNDKLRGKVLDDQGKPLPSATVVLLDQADSTLLYFGITTTTGDWEIKNIKAKSYLMQFAFLGFETEYRAVTIPNPKGEEWGIIALSQKSVSLDGVQVIGEHVPMQFKKDTIEFNARAFKT
ncbi:MAG: carboxypeptidase regulatory-like domain-containing protein, partial [Bacteroidales bacterium]|nr:carboxypeptidase regulatory-like domain-containing protein [Bacteroidales bacterium]